MTKKHEIYKCNICGNIVEVLFEGEGELVCCGEPMVLLEGKTEEEKHEFHKPVIERINHNEVIIKVGEQPHPMTEEHHILMIEAQTPSCIFQKFLKHDDAPEFKITTDEDPVYARAYCNLHGLWKSED